MAVKRIEAEASARSVEGRSQSGVDVVRHVVRSLVCWWLVDKMDLQTFQHPPHLKFRFYYIYLHYVINVVQHNF